MMRDIFLMFVLPMILILGIYGVNKKKRDEAAKSNPASVDEKK